MFNRPKKMNGFMLKLAFVVVFFFGIAFSVWDSADVPAQEADLAARSVALESKHSKTSKAQLKGDAAKKGLELILHERFLPPDFDQETFDNIWKVWPEKLRDKAKLVSAEQRTKLAFERYGFTPRKEDRSKPLQFVVDKDGKWAMNCFACHGGSLYGSNESYPGLPNNRIALETLYADLKKIKPMLKKPYSVMDVGSTLVPMGTTVGTSNAVIFGVTLMALRDKHINLRTFYVPPIVRNHDMDAPPWWHYKKKKMLYIDGFTEKHHRALMPFMMVRQNDGPKFRSRNDQFKLIQSYIESVEAPKYPYPIDQRSAARGKVIFEAQCASCHGTYGDKGHYPEKTIDITEIETDSVRHTALSRTYRKKYGESWLTDYGKAKTIDEPEGYVAPPLDGIWATAPYLHNGSVPTLRAVLNPALRPMIWMRSQDGYNRKDGGLHFESMKKIPAGLNSSQKRKYFDSRKYGKTRTGHDFGERLTPEERDQLIEYLKTL